MGRLVVEEDIGIECFEYLAFLDTAEEEGFVDPHVPCTERSDDAFVCRRVTCCDEGCSDRYGLVWELVLDNGDRF